MSGTPMISPRRLPTRGGRIGDGRTTAAAGDPAASHVARLGAGIAAAGARLAIGSGSAPPRASG